MSAKKRRSSAASAAISDFTAEEEELYNEFLSSESTKTPKSSKKSKPAAKAASKTPPPNSSASKKQAKASPKPKKTPKQKAKEERGREEVEEAPAAPKVSLARTEALQSSLMEFQKEGVEFAISKSGRCLIADEMGLGKTIQAIAIAAHYSGEWPLLVVVPSSMRFTWAVEIEKWLPSVSPSKINVVKGRADCDQLASAWISIVSYPLFVNNAPVVQKISQIGFKVVILDESHYIKNYKAVRTKLLTPVLTKAKRVILLSGTPALSRPIELYPQVSAIRPDLFGKVTGYAKKFCNAHQSYFGWDYSGSSNLKELHTLLQELMIRRLKSQVLDQLPAKRRQRVIIDIDAGMQKELKATSEQLKQWRQNASLNAESVSKFDHDRLIMDAYILTSKAKKKGVVEYVEDMIESGQKFLLFAHHHDMLDALEQCCVRAKAKYMRIDGQTPPTQRHVNVTRFQTDEELKVAILGLTAAGQGLTLTAASTVVFAELHWTPGVLVQAEDRAHRIGQKDSVNVIYLVAKGNDTFDDIMWNMIGRKTGVVSTTLDGKKDTLNADLLAHQPQSSEDSLRNFVRESASPTSSLIPVATSYPKGDLRGFFSGKTSAPKPALSASAPPLSSKETTLPLLAAQAEQQARDSGEAPAVKPGAVVSLLDEEEREEAPSSANSPPAAPLTGSSSGAAYITPNRPLGEAPATMTSTLEMQPECSDGGFFSPELEEKKRKQPQLNLVPASAGRIRTAQKRKREDSPAKQVNTSFPLDSRASGTDLDDSLTSWECDKCTFLNSVVEAPTKCVVCYSARRLTLGQRQERREPLAQEIVVIGDEDSRESFMPTTAGQQSTFCALTSNAPSSLATQSNRKSENFVTPKTSASSALPSSRPSSILSATSREADRPNALYFSVSPNTGRVSLYDCKKQPLCLNFDPEHLRAKEWKFIPLLLHSHHPQNLAQAEAFLKEWEALRPIERKTLANEVISSPLQAAWALSSGAVGPSSNASLSTGGSGTTLSFQRYLDADKRVPTVSKGASSRSADGRSLSTSSSSLPAVGEVVDEGLNSCCVFCNQPISRLEERDFSSSLSPSPSSSASSSSSSLSQKSPKQSHNPYVDKFCSFKCIKEYQMRINGQEIRRQLFTLEHGICQLCGIDAHAFYNKMKSLSPPERIQELMKSKFTVVGSSRLKPGDRMHLDPKEGDFWQADHILPVALGGGECSLMNLRTLCTPCHHLETQELRKELKRMKRDIISQGTGDIRTWMKK